MQALSAPLRRADIRGDPVTPPPVLRSSSTAVERRPAITTLAPLAKKSLGNREAYAGDEDALSAKLYGRRPYAAGG
jgi:hypothetical protein